MLSDVKYQYFTSPHWDGNRRSGVALAMRHRHRGLSTYGLNGQRQGDEHPRLCPSGRGTIYFTCVQTPDNMGNEAYIQFDNTSLTYCQTQSHFGILVAAVIFRSEELPQCLLVSVGDVIGKRSADNVLAHRQRSRP